MEKLIGYIIILMVSGGIFTITAIDIGFWVTLAIWLGSFVILGLMILAVYLINN